MRRPPAGVGCARIPAEKNERSAIHSAVVPQVHLCCEIYGRVARCRSEDDLDDLEEETARRFGPLPAGARDFFAVARLRLDCKRRGIMRLDAGPEAVAATFLPGRLRKVKSKSLQRDGDRVVYASKENEKPFERIEEFIGILDE
jgi:transcription-repair coupling factor (superfamily II helicase)